MKPVKGMKCTICGTDLEVPLCCNEDMQHDKDSESEEKLVCNLCGATEPIPICCNKKIVINA